MPDLEQLQQTIGYHFQNLDLLRQSLTHPSYIQVNPQAGEHNQRLEFLGDAVLSLTLAEKLYHLLPEEREGPLSRCRSSLVKGEKLTDLALHLGVDKHLRMSEGEDQNGGRKRPSILEDALEALAGAIFLDSGLKTAKQVILSWYGEIEPHLENLLNTYNLKGQLQEAVQPVLGNNALKYRVTKETGPSHNKYFKVIVLVAGEKMGEGEGASKKEAEEKAAAIALCKWKQSPSQ